VGDRHEAIDLSTDHRLLRHRATFDAGIVPPFAIMPSRQPGALPDARSTRAERNLPPNSVLRPEGGPSVLRRLLLKDHAPYALPHDVLVRNPSALEARTFRCGFPEGFEVATHVMTPHRTPPSFVDTRETPPQETDPPHFIPW
jgi:hypothetical protein